MIEVNNLSFARGNTLIYKNINFKIRPGELLLIQGANGVGKTTLLSNIVNFIDPLEGSITYNNLVIDNHIASQNFLYIGETNFAHDSLTLNQNIEYWLSIHNVKFNQYQTNFRTRLGCGYTKIPFTMLYEIVCFNV